MAQHSERAGRVDEAIALWQKAAALADHEGHVSIALERCAGIWTMGDYRYAAYRKAYPNSIKLPFLLRLLELDESY